MKIGKWFNNQIKKQQELDSKLSSMEAKEIPLSCPANQPNKECSLVEQLRKKTERI